MTEKSCDDINEALAEAEGYIQRPAGVHKYRWFPPGRQSGIGQADPPDFCGDWKYVGPLWEGLPEYARVEVGINSIPGCQDKGKFRCAILENGGLLGAGFGDTRIEAIARAAHAMGEGTQKHG